MTRQNAIDHAAAYYASGLFRADLARRVAIRTESQETGRLPELRAYLDEEIVPDVTALGFSSEIFENPASGFGPFLISERKEDDGLPTVLIYGHGDVIRGQDAQWRDGLNPWTLTIEGDRWYGRGTADNKGQHSINLGALAAVMAARDGQLGFNVKLLIEMGEESGSPGLRLLAEAEKQKLAADVLIASDGPRLAAERPTVFLGSRGSINFELSVNLRAGGHHSGNWGGLLANPGTILANAIASMVDGQGRILIDALRPPPISDSVRNALADIQPGGGPDAPQIDTDWGEPGLTPAERVFGWNALEVLAFETGNPLAPVNAVPPAARAVMQLRFVVGTNDKHVLKAVRRHLDAHGFTRVTVAPSRMEQFTATRLDPSDPWVGWTLDSIKATTGKTPALLPNLGGSLPNDVFADLLGLPTIWIPHSHPGCSQHAPDEHLLGSIAEEGLRIMAGLFWDLGETGAAQLQVRRAWQTRKSS
jgi:acetylornithine deacetylase/succinyl-diaminopimelate desuccinylase-like protein